jgi:trans-aconitate 2-methyltransferase
VVSRTDAWDPGQYNRFADERERPFWDLAALLDDVTAPTMVDLGCGDGRLTSELARQVGARSMLGVDNSAAMISQAEGHSDEAIRFEIGDIAQFSSSTPLDIIFSNAALHWVPHHSETLAAWTESLARSGQLAVQVPTNADHVAHRIATELATEYLDDPPPDAAAVNVLAPEEYAEILDRLGYVRLSVRLEVYVHHLGSASQVVEWMRGSTLTRFKAAMGQSGFDAYVNELRQRVLGQLGDRSPYVYTFKRILMWGRLA